MLSFEIMVISGLDFPFKLKSGRNHTMVRTYSLYGFEGFSDFCAVSQTIYESFPRVPEKVKKRTNYVYKRS